MRDLEASIGDPEVSETAHSYKERIAALNAEFKMHHYNVVDAVESEAALADEQAILDEHDEAVNLLTSRSKLSLKTLTTRISSNNITIVCQSSSLS